MVSDGVDKTIKDQLTRVMTKRRSGAEKFLMLQIWSAVLRALLERSPVVLSIAPGPFNTRREI
jgi:hypothetical protein